MKRAMQLPPGREDTASFPKNTIRLHPQLATGQPFSTNARFEGPHDVGKSRTVLKIVLLK
jgi:hypothetical protein